MKQIYTSCAEVPDIILTNFGKGSGRDFEGLPKFCGSYFGGLPKYFKFKMGEKTIIIIICRILTQLWGKVQSKES